MKCIKYLLVAFFFFSMSFEMFGQTTQATVIADKLNIRTKPYLYSPKIGQLLEGQKIDYYSSSSKDWAMIEFNGVWGYVSKSYLMIESYSFNGQDEYAVSPDKFDRILKDYHWYNYNPSLNTFEKLDNLETEMYHNEMAESTYKVVKGCNFCIATKDKLYNGDSEKSWYISKGQNYSLTVDPSYKTNLRVGGNVMLQHENERNIFLVSGSSEYEGTNKFPQLLTKNAVLNYIYRIESGKQRENKVQNFKLGGQFFSIHFGDWDKDGKIDFYLADCGESCRHHIYLSSLAKGDEMFGLLATWIDTFGC